MIPPCFAAIILPSEVDIDVVGMNHCRVAICPASEPTAPLLSCPSVVEARGTLDSEQPSVAQHCLSTQAVVAGGGPGELHFSGAVIFPV